MSQTPQISGGQEWQGKINEHLNSAPIILLLVSSDFIASDYCYNVEMQRAIERHKTGEARVIPIILRPVSWEKSLFGQLQGFPKNVKPVTTWENQDEAFKDIVEGINRVVEELN